METEAPVSSRISGTTRVAGVFGYPVGHSLSPLMHAIAYKELGLDWTYVPFSIAPESLEAAVYSIRTLGLIGANVTVPHKSLVIPFLDAIDPDAARIGSVNTIHNDNGILRGYSTDGPGFLDSLVARDVRMEGRTVLVLGAGGSARAIVFALAGSGVSVLLSNRTARRAAELASAVNALFPGSVTVTGWGEPGPSADLIVNTTSLGLGSRAEEKPLLPPGMPHAGQTVYDIIYSPMETNLLSAAKSAGCKVVNGIAMLVHQGVRSISIWSGVPAKDIPADLMEMAVTEELERQCTEV